MTTETGVFHGLTFAEYQAIDAVSSSDLDAFVAGKRKSLGRTGVIGSALHAVVLEPAKAGEMFVTLDRDYNLVTKEGREARRVLEEGTGKTAVKPSEHRKIGELYKAVRGHETAWGAVEAATDKELTVVATLPGFTTPLRCRIDMVTPKAVIDLKSTHCEESDEFRNSIARFRYAMKAAFYADLYHAATGGQQLPFWWLCVSTVPPHDVWMQQCRSEWMALGRRHYMDVLTLYERNQKGDEDV